MAQQVIHVRKEQVGFNLQLCHLEEKYLNMHGVQAHLVEEKLVLQ